MLRAHRSGLSRQDILVPVAGVPLRWCGRPTRSASSQLPTPTSFPNSFRSHQSPPIRKLNRGDHIDRQQYERCLQEDPSCVIPYRHCTRILHDRLDGCRRARSATRERNLRRVWYSHVARCQRSCLGDLRCSCRCLTIRNTWHELGCEALAATVNSRLATWLRVILVLLRHSDRPCGDKGCSGKARPACRGAGHKQRAT
jgi:hypothetical protein